jgi:hypothetical protein
MSLCIKPSGTWGRIDICNELSTVKSPPLKNKKASKIDKYE